MTIAPHDRIATLPTPSPTDRGQGFGVFCGGLLVGKGVGAVRSRLRPAGLLFLVSSEKHWRSLPEGLAAIAQR